MPKMRTIQEAVRYVRKTDPESALTPHALRSWVLSGRMPHVRIGAKRLVDVDLLEKYLSGEFVPSLPEAKVLGVVRPLPEKWGGHNVQ